MSAVSGVGTGKTDGVYDYQKKYGKNNTGKAEEEAAAEQADSFEKSNSAAEPSGVYTRDTVKLKQLNASQKAYIQGLQSLVSELVNQVGKNGTANGQNKFNASVGGINPKEVDSYWDLLVDNGDGTFSFHPDLSVEDQEKLIAKAKEDISEDGYYGVKQTSARILDYAKAITGGDPSKIDEMRQMAQEAFDSVRDIMGGELPEISQQTYDAVMKGFDEWAASAAQQ